MQSVMTIVDAHVHIYSEFSLAELLEKAFENSWHVAHFHGYDRFQTLLLLTETAGERWFADHAADLQGRDINGWRGDKCQDEPVIVFQRQHHTIALVAGYQLATQEGLEVLGIGSQQRVANGMDLATTVEVVKKQGAIPVIPWAVGKWLGKRGTLLRSFLENTDLEGLCLGDNGGRPWFWPAPRLFDWMRAKGRPILPGSDPLPLPNQEKRVAGFGFFTTQPIDISAPMASLKQLLLSKDPSISPFGKLETVIGFFSKQIGLRMRK